MTSTTGHQVVAHTAYPKGHRHHPLSDAEVEDKFRRLTAGRLTVRQGETALESLWGLERLLSMHTLYDRLVVEPQA